MNIPTLAHFGERLQTTLYSLEQGCRNLKTQRPKPPRKLPYKGRRSRKFLRDDEVIRLMQAASKVGRNRHRDATLILMMYRHGLRVSEANALTWENVDLNVRRLFVRRLKNGKSSIQVLNEEQTHALTKLRDDQGERTQAVFVSAQGEGLTRSTIYKMIARAGKRAGLEVEVNTHMLRHSCGHHLTNVRKVDARRIQDYLGHRDIRHTVAYTELDENKFDGLWGD